MFWTVKHIYEWHVQAKGLQIHIGGKLATGKGIFKHGWNIFHIIVAILFLGLLVKLTSTQLILVFCLKHY